MNRTIERRSMIDRQPACYPCFHFVSYPTENGENLRVVPFGLCRIVKGPMKLCALPRKERAITGGIVTDSDDIIETRMKEVMQVFRGLCGDIDSDFLHDAHCRRMHTFRLKTCRTNFDALPAIMTKEPFGHLRPTGIAGAQDQYVNDRISHTASTPRARASPFPQESRESFSVASVRLRVGRARAQKCLQTCRKRRLLQPIVNPG